MHRTLLLAFALAGCAEAPEPLNLTPSEAPFALEAGATFYSDVAYGDDERQVLDLFVPEGTGPFPIVFEVHGGGFVGGDEDALYEIEEGRAGIEEALAAGAAFANVEYRVLDEVDDEGVIKSLGDSRYALQFLRWHAEELGLDGAHVVGRGHRRGRAP